MANQITSNPWIIDTPSDNVLFDNDLEHCQIEYVMYDATASPIPAAEVQSRTGRLVAFLQGISNGMTVRSGRIGWVQGLKVPVLNSNGQPNMGSGKLLVYYE